MAPPDTKTRILDTAEQLFARNGFHNTSLRDITGQATVNLAAVNYHFGSKDGLLKAVIERRIEPLNQLRQQKLEELLAAAKAAGQRPSVRHLMHAFIEPTLAFRRSAKGAADFIALIGRSLSEPDETVRNCFIESILPLFRLLFRGLQQALPELPERLLLTRLQFTMGALSHMMIASSRPVLPVPGFPEPLTEDQMAEQLIAFVSCGLEAPC